MTRRAVAGALGLLAAAIVCTQVWRASELSITHDEAITYLRWVARPWSQLTRDYLPNNHLLHTAAAKIATDALGASPLTLRLPALASGVVFLALLAWLARTTWGGAAGVFGFVALALHPILLDFFACARGYGPALAGLLGCIVIMLRLLHETPRKPRAWLVALGVGLAAVIATNPAFAFSAAALLVAFALLVWRLRPPGIGLRDVTWFAGAPAACGAAATAWWILASARLAAFSLGAASWSAAFAPWPPLWFRHFDLGDAYLRTARLDVLVFGYGGVLLAVLLAIAAVGAGWWSFLLWRPRSGFALSPAMLLFAMCGGAGLLSVLAATLAHVSLGLPLPDKRTSLPIVLYVALMTPAAWAAVRGHGAIARAAAAMLGVVLCVVIALEVSVFPSRSYAEFRFDAGSRLVHRELQRLAPPGRALRVVSLPFYFEPTQNYYRSVLGSEWLEEVDPEIRPGVQYDFALVPRGLVDHPLFAPLLGSVVWVEPESDCAIVEMKRP